MPGKFDLAHLQAIHKRLFGDVYDWAGEIRTVDISKGQTRFASFQQIRAMRLRSPGPCSASDSCAGSTSVNELAITLESSMCCTRSEKEMGDPSESSSANWPAVQAMPWNGVASSGRT